MEGSRQDESNILAKVGKHFHLIETSGDVRQIGGELTQLDKRLGEISKRVDDQWKAMRVWIMILSFILGGLSIALLVAT